MKQLLIILALLVLSTQTPFFGQASYAQESTPSAEQKSDSASSEENKGVKISIDMGDDDELSDAEKIKEVTKLVGKFNSELAEELEVELEGLSDDEKAKLVEKFQTGIPFDDGDGIPAGAVVISIVAIVMIFGSPIFLLIALLTSGYRRRKQKMELVNLYLAQDKEVPEHVLNGVDGSGASNSLRSGLTLTAVGIGVYVGLTVAGGEEAAGFALIPMFLGLARLLFWFLDERKNADK